MDTSQRTWCGQQEARVFIKSKSMKRVAAYALFVTIAIYALSWAFIGRNSILPATGSDLGLEWVDRFKCMFIFDDEIYDDTSVSFGDFNAKAQAEFLYRLRAISDSIIVKSGAHDDNKLVQQELIDSNCAFIMINIRRNIPFISKVEVDFLIGSGSASYAHRYMWFFGWRHVGVWRTSMS